MNVQHPTSQSTSATPTASRIVAALVSIDVSYEDRRPVFVRPIVLTSEGLKVRHVDGSPVHMSDAEEWPGEQFGLWSEEKVLGLIPVKALLVGADSGFEFRSEGA